MVVGGVGGVLGGICGMCGGVRWVGYEGRMVVLGGGCVGLVVSGRWLMSGAWWGQVHLL